MSENKKKEKVEMTPEMMMMREQIRELRKERRQRSMDKMADGMGKAMSKMVPKGIKHPDSLVRNSHLYTGVQKKEDSPRKRIRLF